MIDPVIFKIGNFALRWYGVIVMIGVVVASLIIERQLRQRGEKSERIWDALIWVLPIGIIGARLWYVFNATVGGNRYYVENPIQILNIPQGGLHIFGGFLFGAIALVIFLRRNKLDPWLFLDAAGPAALIGQGIGRIANFINQELYGPPTSLPWGIPIAAEHRLPAYQDLSQYPVEATHFHPTFAYELLWNFVTAGILLWLSRRYEKQLKPGTIFAGWLIAAGFGRTWIELFFRPDQPKIPGTIISYSSIFAALMGIVGVIMLLVRYNRINLAFAQNWEEEYQVSANAETDPGVEEPAEEQKVSPARKAPRRTPARRASAEPRGTRRTTRTKKSSQ